jgi:hypothetical protein
MDDNLSLVSLRTIFRFPFQGNQWLNRFLPGALLILAGHIIPIVPLLFVGGYYLQVMRQSIRGEELSMPAWTDWGKLAVDGLRGCFVYLVFLLPACLVMFAGWTIYFGTLFTTGFLSGVEQPDETLMGWAFLVSFGIFWLSMLFSTLFLFIGGAPLPAATAHMVAKERLAAAFYLREWTAILRRDVLGYFIAWVVVMGLGSILYLGYMTIYFTMLLCCLLPFFISPVLFYTGLVGAAIFGQIYRGGAQLDAPAVLEDQPATPST